MKKKVWLWVLAVAALLAVLFVPIPNGTLNDGGTRSFTALTYKIVNWHRLIDGGSQYDRTRVYWFPDNFQSLSELWSREKSNVEHTFVATVMESNGATVVVQPVEGSTVLSSADKISINTEDLEQIEVKKGSVVQVTFTGDVMETYPLQIHAIRWKLSDDLRHMEYTDQWLDKNTAEKMDNNVFDHVTITRIYKNCFFVRTVIPWPYEIKLNGQLSEEWCVGDQVICTYENTYYNNKSHRYEADMLTIAPSDWEPEPFAAYKPVIYLYPEEKTEISVKLMLDGKLTCTYPSYQNGWYVTAAPDGTLTDRNGQTYNYLYWEGKTYAQWDMTEGFCVRGEDTAKFLEQALEKLGLTRREANEFIVYWLPLMEQNPYNIISFQTDIYTDAAKLQIDPAPDTVIRVFMAWKAAESFVEVPAQELTAPARTGFTVIEWGGTEVK